MQTSLSLENQPRMPLFTPILQPTNRTCGQSCVVMVSGYSFEQVYQATGTTPNRGTHGTHLIRALQKFKVECDGKSYLIRRGTNEIPPTAIVRMQANRKSDFPGWYGHWIVRYKDFVLDPSFGEAFPFEDYLNRFMRDKHFTSFIAVYPPKEAKCFF